MNGSARVRVLSCRVSAPSMAQAVQGYCEQGERQPHFVRSIATKEIFEVIFEPSFQDARRIKFRMIDERGQPADVLSDGIVEGGESEWDLLFWEQIE